MSVTNLTDMQKVNASYRTLRRLLGQFGILLPWLLYTRNDFTFETSISDFYYTPATALFTGLMIAFGLFLFTYKGHPIDKAKGEWISDNGLTNIGGIFAIGVALIPTTCGEGSMNPLCHFDKTAGMIHLICAALFLAIMGGVAYFKFTLSPSKRWNWLYRSSAIVVWVSIVAMGVYFKMDPEYEYGILVGEIIALTAFGIAWLVKGRFTEMTILTMFRTKK